MHARPKIPEVCGWWFEPDTAEGLLSEGRADWSPSHGISSRIPTCQSVSGRAAAECL